MNEKIEFLSAILIVSKNPDRLANFYRDIVGLPLEDEQHGETHKHYGCELGDLHFAIHPTENFEGAATDVGAIKLAFTVFDMNAFVAKVERAGVKLAYPPKDTGFSLMTALNDPDGNYVEFTQLTDRWFKHLENRRTKGIDVIARWKETKKS
jgi:predicted enzyme related to lactoylglutathione lyase